ncbi:MAG: hypothetical protein A3H72_01160 [Candidatus Doudnabacteria bacterium RIFCSPLOWO2_02_FULL_48_8]|uniref:Uncharacterized protein n=1 Tax=Candidatus Doudnabacteria bacterium RIFCSPHIGHO2_01_FULL_46_24 TaxID=1817825 RepID=A0A1F5NUT3_9BACT|nr:MAG: hypothetical protein A2720_02710 [Candidatus Doudnabacteria bacterium RIFCSPHIGHO2_01_FULL_46_24]OGE95007.1 MAG: hypothetical protein A3H72_01160 [Candidatus Doudnabacteria bacterium RIFCSPLOWO2_02_FULL_48_8]OGE95954.1 MAG: hypothetical protein A3E98_00705 [Candidatus Doudnabacteria bacterium RIFCSPHIGHO2_12_FULL_48_11]
MTQAVITKIKSNSILLPKTWKGSKVLLRITDNTATITKVPKTSNIFSLQEIKAWRRLGKKVAKSTLNKALAKARE